ncbi:MAG TPA: hypothetical protein VHZ54_02480 [Solirubrobacterales bacterium]|nr:hypothetical protein [Solirubrobacterales bacterium]
MISPDSASGGFPHPSRRAWRSWSLLIVALLLCSLAPAAGARAANLLTLDPGAETPGNIVEDGAGNAYVAWAHEGAAGSPDTPMFCKIPRGGGCPLPISLPVPAAAAPGVGGVFPVLGTGSTVYVLAPQRLNEDVLVWTSTNGGASFGPAAAEPVVPGKTNPTDVLLKGSTFYMGEYNPGLGFTTVGKGAGRLSFTYTGPGGLEDSTFAFDPAGNPVEAYWESGTEHTPRTVRFYRYGGSGPVDGESSWIPHEEGVSEVGAGSDVGPGSEPRLAGGPAGLLLTYQHQEEGGPTPGALVVGKYTGTGFGAPVTVGVDPDYDLFRGGAIAQSPTGEIAVVWPWASGALELFTSSDGGATFSAGNPIASFPSNYYPDGTNARMTVGADGQGWLTYRDLNGLELADLAPTTTGSTAGPSPTPAASAVTTAKKPATYGGPTKTTSLTVGGERFTLKVPKACLAPAQPFYVGVGRQKRHGLAKALRGKIKVTEVTFTFEGLKKILKKKPYRWLIVPPALAPGKHTVRARVALLVDKKGTSKRLVKTLTGKVSPC